MEKISKENFWEIAFLKVWRPYLWIFIIGFLVYLKTLSFGYVDYDDRYLIIDNHIFLDNLSNIFQAFRQDVFSVPFHYSSKSYYRPLLTISLMLDTQLGGVTPFIYHLTNIIIHLIASCLVFLCLLKLGYRKEQVLFFSLLFSIHPVLTQAVAWIPGRNDSLLTVFVLSAFISFIHLIESPKRKYYFCHMLFFSLALFTKETALPFIFICLLYLYVVKKGKLSSTTKISLILGWLIIISFWFFLRTGAIDNPKITPFLIIKSLLFNLPGIIQYGGKILFPFNLSVYPIMRDISPLYGIITLTLFIIVILISRNKNINLIIWGSLWYVLFLLPSLISAKPGRYTVLFEHRVYLSLMGIIIILLETDLVKKLHCRKKSSAILSAGVILIFALITFYHSDNMRNAINFWENAATTSIHSSVAHLNLGDKYYSRRLIHKAEKEFRKALELNPQQPMAHNNLGRIYANKQMFKEAEEEFRAELRINPRYDNAIYNLGMLKYEQGEVQTAIDLWKKALEINPYHIKANRYLAIYYKRGILLRPFIM